MDTKLLKIGQGILLIFLIIYVGSLIDWIFYPFIVIFQTLFFPIILAGFLFYLLRPLVKIINKKLSRSLSILLVYLILICIGIGLVLIIGPILQRQFYGLINNMPFIIAEIQRNFVNIQESSAFQADQLGGMLNVEELIFQLGNLLNQLGRSLATNLANFIGVLANAVIVLVIVPFILFYLLRDGEKLGKSILKVFNEKRRDDIQQVLMDIDRTLSSYIQGQGIVCLCVGALCYVTFLIIGLDYALLLAVIAGVTNIIPYFGPWIGTIPAVIVGLFQSPALAILIIVLVLIIQQVESSFIAPQVIGKKLKMHPVTVMFLILAAGRLIGLIGMILVVPVYGVCRVIFTHSLKIWRLKLKKK
ncbi:Predicted PurR-regulated permease PerM [Natronincola peptidivorans]|uniref:Predicted PurR-regulated permease PerM n=1 Tax=Natronincola peptidivorans TaxID=426128 RepID=A0A1H9Y4H7_9FIRM|nr:AI-2E family transporter [Natronincola peptidivorans]SES63254.1 Predicted PurR-regulated permease PerM [Natronincola peptidivorans]